MFYELVLKNFGAPYKTFTVKDCEEACAKEMLTFLVRRTTKLFKNCLINSVELRSLSSFGMMKSIQEPFNDNKAHKSSRVRTRSLSELTDTEIESREVGDFNNFRISKKAIKKLKGKSHYRIKYFDERMTPTLAS